MHTGSLNGAAHQRDRPDGRELLLERHPPREIEAADDSAPESWRNLIAINDLVRDIVETDSHFVISALGGDAAAGGVPLALAADHRGRSRRHRAEPLLPAHGRPVRLGVLDLSVAQEGRRRHRRRLTSAPFTDRSPDAVRMVSWTRPSAPPSTPSIDRSVPSPRPLARDADLQPPARGKTSAGAPATSESSHWRHMGS